MSLYTTIVFHLSGGGEVARVPSARLNRQAVLEERPLTFFRFQGIPGIYRVMGWRPMDNTTAGVVVRRIDPDMALALATHAHRRGRK